MKYGESEVGILSEGIKNIIDDIQAGASVLLMQSRVALLMLDKHLNN